MFKTLSIALISLLGMNYANDSGNNVPRLNASVRDETALYGGISYDQMESGFYYIDSDFRYGPLDVDYAPYQIYCYAYSCVIYLRADYILFNDGTNVYEKYDYVGNFRIQNEFVEGRLTIEFDDFFTFQLDENESEQTGIEQYYEGLDLNKYALYFDNPVVDHITALRFLQDNTLFTINSISQRVNKLIPLLIDDRFTWLNYDYDFGSDIFALGYFNYDNSAYYALGYAVQSSATRADNINIFKGLFKSFDNYYDAYDIQFMQNINGNQYFGPLGTTSLSECIHLTNSDFFYPFAGRYHNNGYDNTHGYDYVWYTLYTQIGTSGTVNTAISNVRSFQHPNFSRLHIYYQLNDFTNQTRLYAKTYYDLLTYNPNYNVLPGGGTSGNGLQGAFDLLGTAFNKLWQVGNIAVLGSITLNTLILLPLVISLMLFVIHLIKKG